MEHINTWHSDAACCIASGDLTDNGTAEEYAALSQILADLRPPFLPMIGNHDHRETLMAALPPPGPAMTNYMQYRWDVGDTVVLCLDTQNPGHDSGIFDEIRLAWLEQELAKCRNSQVLVFMHHPPGALGLGPLDEMPLINFGPLMSILSAAPQVAHIFCGHVHRCVNGTISSVPFSTLRSISHQTRPPYQNWDWDDCVAKDETPQYGLILIGEDRIVTQFLDLEEAR